MAELLHRGSRPLVRERFQQVEKASLPERPEINESVTVIGSGIAGCTTAWVLSEAGYKVRIIEQLDTPFAGTSLGALGIHLGGRYPKSWHTAVECLQSAILMKKAMPFAFGDQALRFLISTNSDISFIDYVDFYTRLKNYYASLPEKDQIFGASEDFFRVLQPHELSNFAHIQGGIATQEPVFNMDRTRHTLLSTLEARSVEIVTSTEVTNIQKDPATSPYSLTLKDKKTNTVTTTTSDIVVNASNYNARILGEHLGDTPTVKMDLKTFHDVYVDKQTEETYPFPVVILFPGVMHYLPLGNGVASIVGFGETVDSLAVNQGENISLPSHWHNQLQRRSQDRGTWNTSLIENARIFMPSLDAYATTFDMYPGVAVSFTHDQSSKVQPKVEHNEKLPGYFRVVPTKASHAINLALATLQCVLENSLKKGVISEIPSYAKSILEGDHAVGYILPEQTGLYEAITA